MSEILDMITENGNGEKIIDNHVDDTNCTITSSNNEKLVDAIIGAKSSNSTVSVTTTDSVSSNDQEEDNSSDIASHSENRGWSTSTKVLVGLGTAAAVVVAGYGLYRFFSGDDSAEEFDDLSVEVKE